MIGEVKVFYIQSMTLY